MSQPAHAVQLAAQHPTPPAAASDSLLEARYSARLEALEIRKETIEQLVNWIKYGGSTVAVGLALLGWWFGSSYSEATNNAQKAASSAFEREFFRNTENAKDFSDLKQKYEAAIASLTKIVSDLKGYVALREIVGKVENFDPLELYSALDQEIDLRERKTRQYTTSGDTPITETTHDPAFRQKAAFIFQRLLNVVREDAKSGKPKIEVITLFNAAANAAKVDMDFVSLELMEAAVAQDKSKTPENEARLIRQRLTMSRISDEQSLAAMREVIRRTSGFNVHHVLSEAFNVGLRTANPAGMGRMIMDELPNDLKSTSYAQLIAARLLSMGNNAADWTPASTLKAKGVAALHSEPKTVRWHSSSLSEARRLEDLQ